MSENKILSFIKERLSYYFVNKNENNDITLLKKYNNNTKKLIEFKLSSICIEFFKHKVESNKDNKSQNDNDKENINNVNNLNNNNDEHLEQLQPLQPLERLIEENVIKFFIPLSLVPVFYYLLLDIELFKKALCFFIKFNDNFTNIEYSFVDIDIFLNKFINEKVFRKEPSYDQFKSIPNIQKFEWFTDNTYFDVLVR